MKTVKQLARIALGMALGYAGFTHLTSNRLEFRAQVPNWVPFSADFVVLASGVVEIVLGLALVFLVWIPIERVWCVFSFNRCWFSGRFGQLGQ